MDGQFPIRPFGDQFVVQPDPDITNQGGIELPQPQRQRTGMIVAVGPEVDDDIEVGMRVQWFYDPVTRFTLPDFPGEFIRLQAHDCLGEIMEAPNVPTINSSDGREPVHHHV